MVRPRPGRENNGVDKLCPDCGTVKPLGEFGRNKALQDGHSFYCKECARLRSNRLYRERAVQQGRAVRERTEVPEGTKWCPTCRTVVPHAGWHKTARSADGFASACKACRKVRGARDHLKRTYGLTPEDVERMLLAQRRLCGICRRRPAAHVDHDHRSGAVRGMLCFLCNVLLGHAEDDVRVLVAAVGYLERFPSVGPPRAADARWREVPTLMVGPLSADWERRN
ncbi:recombination endonuclease VII [Actinocorallia herbida]|uniref:Recombination endonuclease VII n=1 Tax=Actinocorallia herbida TaxID=58109 RepID=A0A3N1D4H2_9ACTN|nr:recombination endonuclease VII [Actinocorallia herbida]